MSEILQYKLRIKEWERGFASKHGRIPSKADVKADEEIRKAYKAYNELKKSEKLQPDLSKSVDKTDFGNRKSSSSITKDSSRSSAKNIFKDADSADKNSEKSLHQSETGGFGQNKRRKTTHHSPLLPSVDIQLTDDEDYEPIVPVQNAELGPTPQANGKVLSIFDLILSPPESSPLKQQSTDSGHQLLPPSILHPSSPFKTPSKAVKRIDLGNLTPSRGLSLAEKLRMASSPSKPGKTPGSPSKNDIIETPLYLGKVINKFSFMDQDTPLDRSPSKSQVFQTPTKAPTTENFQVSPSPLKTQRFLSKKLSDIFHQQQNLVMDEAFEAQRLEFEKEFEETEKTSEQETPTVENLKDMRRRKKATTQKRTTRRWKIKPRTAGEEADTFEGKDVHEEMQKIDTQDRSELAKYIEGETSEEELSEEEEAVVRKTPASTKINPVSNNYQRLKINDPRAKKFKQRMKRR